MLGRKTELSLKTLALQPGGQQPFSLSELNTSFRRGQTENTLFTRQKVDITNQFGDHQTSKSTRTEYEAWLDVELLQAK